MGRESIEQTADSHVVDEGCRGEIEGVQHQQFVVYSVVAVQRVRVPGAECSGWNFGDGWGPA